MSSMRVICEKMSTWLGFGFGFGFRVRVRARVQG